MTHSMGLEDGIRKFVLQNAIRYGGKADPKAIVGKAMGQFAELRKDPKSAMITISAVVDEVNNMTPEEQKAELEESAPEMLEKKEQENQQLIQEKEAIQALLDESKEQNAALARDYKKLEIDNKNLLEQAKLISKERKNKRSPICF